MSNYVASTFTSGETPTTSQWNQLWINDAAFNTALTGTQTISPFTMTTPVWQYLGYAQITSNFTGAATSFSVVTGLSVAVTIPSGVTNVKVTVGGAYMTISATAGNLALLDIYDVTGSAEVGGVQTSTPTNGYFMNPNFISPIAAPAAGSRTYELRYSQNSAGTFTLAATSTNPAFILVECC